MSTALYESVIFGPVRSRRLGLSLGVNLLPLHDKLCSFDCIYCECGWGKPGAKPRFNSRETVRRRLGLSLPEWVAAGPPPAFFTFAGTGQPTMHPEFGGVIDDTIAVRDELCPSAKISVLSNATMIGRETVREALLKADNNILKLDSAFDETVRLVDRPKGAYSVRQTVEAMKLFDGRLIVQTMFLRGTLEGRQVDNTTEREVAAWLSLIEEIAPSSVMVYTIDRDTPADDLHKVSVEELRRIAERVERLGIPCSVAG